VESYRQPLKTKRAAVAAVPTLKEIRPAHEQLPQAPSRLQILLKVAKHRAFARAAICGLMLTVSCRFSRAPILPLRALQVHSQHARIILHFPSSLSPRPQLSLPYPSGMKCLVTRERSLIVSRRTDPHGWKRPRQYVSFSRQRVNYATTVTTAVPPSAAFRSSIFLVVCVPSVQSLIVHRL
jgi:hypothetical protein